MPTDAHEAPMDVHSTGSEEFSDGLEDAAQPVTNMTVEELENDIEKQTKQVAGRLEDRKKKLSITAAHDITAGQESEPLEENLDPSQSSRGSGFRDFYELLAHPNAPNFRQEFERLKDEETNRLRKQLEQEVTEKEREWRYHVEEQDNERSILYKERERRIYKDDKKRRDRIQKENAEREKFTKERLARMAQEDKERAERIQAEEDIMKAHLEQRQREYQEKWRLEDERRKKRQFEEEEKKKQELLEKASPVGISGTLLYQTGSGRRKKWYSRFVILNTAKDKRMFCYKTERDFARLSPITNDVTHIDMNTIVTAAFLDSGRTGKEKLPTDHQYGVLLASCSRIHIFAVREKDEAIKWVKSLQKAIDQLQGPSVDETDDELKTPHALAMAMPLRRDRKLSWEESILLAPPDNLDDLDDISSSDDGSAFVNDSDSRSGILMGGLSPPKSPATTHKSKHHKHSSQSTSSQSIWHKFLRVDNSGIPDEEYTSDEEQVSFFAQHRRNSQPILEDIRNIVSKT